MGVLALWALHQHYPAPYEPQMNLRQFARRAELCYEAEFRRERGGEWLGRRAAEARAGARSSTG